MIGRDSVTAVIMIVIVGIETLKEQTENPSGSKAANHEKTHKEEGRGKKWPHGKHQK